MPFLLGPEAYVTFACAWGIVLSLAAVAGMKAGYTS
jgi:hypothetical protein